MDCCDSIDDYCDVWQSTDLQIPEKIPSVENNLDLFFIAIDVEVTNPSADEEEEDRELEEDKDFVIPIVTGTNFLTFWEPCPRLKSGNLSKDRISSILSKAGVPLHKQDFMIDRISSRADYIANSPFNEQSKVLPLFVSISIVKCSCFHQD